MSPNSKERINGHVENIESETIENKLPHIKKLPEKKFESRNSLLTDLFQNPHINTVYHIFVASLVCLFVNTTAHDYLTNGEIHLGFTLIGLGFAKFHIAAVSWVLINIIVTLGFLCFNTWAQKRKHFSPKSLNLKLWDTLWLVLLFVYYIFSFSWTSLVVTTFELAPASAAVILLEQTRLLMKFHSFVRYNAPKVLRFKTHSEKELSLPKYSHFFYFLFAPTLLYRDEYPRTKTIHWDFVAYRIMEIIGVIFYYSFVLGKLLIPHCQDFGTRQFSWSEIVLIIFENSVTGILLLLCGFYIVLHSVQNLFAELLTFGDRMFYKDWWTCTSYAEYFRIWNIVVHDWLYNYVYKDFYEIVFPGKKFVAKLAVFTISAVVHEWVMSYMFGFFLPAMFIQFFLAGTLLSNLNTPKYPVLNIFFWYGLAFGAGSLASIYTLEFYARRNVPFENPTIKDLFIPRIFTCNCIS